MIHKQIKNYTIVSKLFSSHKSDGIFALDTNFYRIRCLIFKTLYSIVDAQQFYIYKWDTWSRQSKVQEISVHNHENFPCHVNKKQKKKTKRTHK